MPPNNPGHDIQVDRGAAGVLYVEVKGTARAAPVFLMSETERAFSELHQADYELLVVYGIDLAAGTHRVRVRPGAVTAATHRLVVPAHPLDDRMPRVRPAGPTGPGEGGRPATPGAARRRVR